MNFVMVAVCKRMQPHHFKTAASFCPFHRFEVPFMNVISCSEFSVRNGLFQPG
jgi:hypothetical protein